MMDKLKGYSSDFLDIFNSLQPDPSSMTDEEFEDFISKTQTGSKLELKQIILTTNPPKEKMSWLTKKFLKKL